MSSEDAIEPREDHGAEDGGVTRALAADRSMARAAFPTIIRTGDLIPQGPQAVVPVDETRDLWVVSAWTLLQGLALWMGTWSVGWAAAFLAPGLLAAIGWGLLRNRAAPAMLGMSAATMALSVWLWPDHPGGPDWLMLSAYFSTAAVGAAITAADVRAALHERRNAFVVLEGGSQAALPSQVTRLIHARVSRAAREIGYLPRQLGLQVSGGQPIRFVSRPDCGRLVIHAQIRDRDTGAVLAEADSDGETADARGLAVDTSRRLLRQLSAHPSMPALPGEWME